MARRSSRFRYSSERAQTAVVIALQEPFEAAHEVASSSIELTRLAATLGIEVVRTVVQERQHASASHLLSDGKIRELRRFTAPALEPDEASVGTLTPEEPVDLVLVDGSLTPGQQRALERELEVQVLDRTAVILRIFEWRARTREARLQVRLARLIYETPRIRDDRSLGDREGGGGRGGRGNSNVELKKQQNRRAIAELRRELEATASAERGRRSRRDLPHVALVGYTNAGKSSLMRALTGSEVLVEDKLFATLQLTVRALAGGSGPRILVADTVGFIDDLPHELVASFRSTLDEARDAQLLLIVADCSDRDFREQLYVTRQTLAEIGAGEVPHLLVLNKADKLSVRERQYLALEFPEAMLISAHDASDVAALRERVVRQFEGELVEATIEVPYARSALLAKLHAEAQVIERQHGPRGTRVRLRSSPAGLSRLRETLGRKSVRTAHPL